MSVCLQESDFLSCCRGLVQLSEQLRSGWSWEEPLQGSQDGFLKKTQLRSVSITSGSGLGAESNSLGRTGSDQPDPQSLEAENNLEEETAEEEDVVVCSKSEQNNNKVLQFEYHVLYSCSYFSPVLYFRASTMEGKSLSLEDVWSSVHPNLRVELQLRPLDVISQQEHPLLGQPFFMLHPCRTHEFMRPLLHMAEEQHRSLNYVLTWLSVVGPLVGLDVPLTFATKL